MQSQFIRAGEVLEGLTADEQLEVASQLTIVILKAARHGFEGAAGDRRTYDVLCDTLAEWLRTEIASLRFAPVQRDQ